MAGNRSVNEIDANVGQAIQRRRALSGISEDDLAAKLGVSVEQLRQFESGQARAGASVLFAMSQVLNVPISCFYEWAANDAEGPSLAKVRLAILQGVDKP